MSSIDEQGTQMLKYKAGQSSTPNGRETRCFAKLDTIGQTLTVSAFKQSRNSDSMDKTDMKQSDQGDRLRTLTTAEHNKALLEKAKRDIAAMNEKAEQFRQRIKMVKEQN